MLTSLDLEGGFLCDLNLNLPFNRGRSGGESRQFTRTNVNS